MRNQIKFVITGLILAGASSLASAGVPAEWTVRGRYAAECAPLDEGSSEFWRRGCDLLVSALAAEESESVVTPLDISYRRRRAIPRRHRGNAEPRGNCFLNMPGLLPYGDNMTKADCRREGLGVWAPYGGGIENTGA